MILSLGEPMDLLVGSLGDISKLFMERHNSPQNVCEVALDEIELEVKLYCVSAGRLHQAEDPEPGRAHGPAGGQPGRALQALHGATQFPAECLRGRS
jgi:hypothetical protein